MRSSLVDVTSVPPSAASGGGGQSASTEGGDPPAAGRGGFDLDPAILRRREGRPGLRLPEAGRRRPLRELRVSWECLRRIIADTDDHPAVFEILHQLPIGDVLRLYNGRLALLDDPRFVDLWTRRSLPALDTAGARRLEGLAPGSLGREYARFVLGRGLDDTFLDWVPLPEDPVAYLAFRTVLLHDLIHFITGYEPHDRLQEVALEVFLLTQTGALNHALFMAGYALNFTAGSPGRLAQLPRTCREARRDAQQAAPLLLVEWQLMLERPLQEVRAELGLDRRPPCVT